MKTRHILSFTAAATGVVSAQTVEFFYTQTIDLCKINNSTLGADQETTHGGICAWRSDSERLYACPAPDPTCWTWAQKCNANTIGQVVCNRAGTVFCCDAVSGETCTTTSGQINVCISNFTSPNSGVPIAQANSAYYSALGVSNVTATSQFADPTPFSTRNLIATSSTTSSATQPGSTTVNTQTSLSASTSRSSSSATSLSSNTSSTSSTLSGGAIAGIVIGALALLALIGAAIFLILRRRKRSTTPAPNEMATDTTSGAHPASNEKDQFGGYYSNSHVAQASELGSEGHTRFEMPSDNSRLYANSTQRQELP